MMRQHTPLNSHGTEYYRYDSTGAQPVALHQAIKIPVQTSYDIQLSGISLDSLIRLYNGRRYQQWINPLIPAESQPASRLNPLPDFLRRRVPVRRLLCPAHEPE